VALGAGAEGVALVLSEEVLLLELSFVAVPLVLDGDEPAEEDDDVLRLSFL
jgi:hypothetical protein